MSASSAVAAAVPPASAYLAAGTRHYASTALTRGPWSEHHQHAGPGVALVVREIEQEAHALGLTHMARVTANLIRPIPLAELTVEVAVDYAGRNAAHLSARLLTHGKELGRFTALAQREVAVSLPAEIDGHPLPTLEPGPEAAPAEAFPWPSGDLGYHTLMETRAAFGHFGAGACALWMRMRHPLLPDETPSGAQRVAVAADSGNGISAALDFHRFTFLNSDLTINLLRPARGEWICIDARTLVGPSGGGVAEARIFDTAGLIGRSTQSLMIRAR